VANKAKQQLGLRALPQHLYLEASPRAQLLRQGAKIKSRGLRGGS